MLIPYKSISRVFLADTMLSGWARSRHARDPWFIGKQRFSLGAIAPQEDPVMSPCS